jgi:hypothetical protein
MRLNTKNYKIVKFKKYVKTNNLFIIVHGINKNTEDWIITEQELKKLDFTYYKILNKISTKIINCSIYSRIVITINGSTFFMKPKSLILSKQTILTNLEPLMFIVLTLQLNNKVYSTKQIKSTYSIKYKKTKLLSYQYNTTNIKCC